MTNRKFKALFYYQRWLLIGYAMVISVVYFSLHPKPPDVSVVSFGDKLVHFSAYFLMACWFLQIYQKVYSWRPIVGLILLGCCIEIAQGFTDSRTFEWLDILANTSGLAVAWFLTQGKAGDLLLNFERTFLIKNP